MKLKNILASICLVTLSSTASAGIISGEYATEGGKSVNLQGLEWLSLDHTQGMSRNDIEGGFTDKYGTVWAEDDWEYASLAQTDVLMRSVWGEEFEGRATSNYDGAEWFLENFGTMAYNKTGGYFSPLSDKFGYSQFIFGTNGVDSCANGTVSCFAQIGIYDSSSSSNDLLDINVSGVQAVSVSASDDAFGMIQGYNGLDLDGRYYRSEPYFNYYKHSYNGSLLVRAAQAGNSIEVPEPSSLAILGLGLLGLVRFRKKA